MTRGARAMLLATLLASAPPPAAADPDRAMSAGARRHFERGLAAYDARDYQTAVDQLRAGHALDPHPDFLFPWAQAERLSGDCASALPLYRQVLTTGVAGDDAQDVLRLIATCERSLADSRPPPRRAPLRQGEATATGAPQGSPTPTPRPPPATPRDQRSWLGDPLGLTLTATGVIGLGLGTGMLVAARSAAAEADRAADLDGFIDAVDTADRRRALGYVALGVGGALVVGGLVRYALVAGKADDDPPALAIGTGPASLTLTLAGRF